MKNKLVKIAFGAALITISSLSVAQFNITKMFDSATGSGASVTSEGLVKNYVEGTKYVMSADVKMLKALGLKEQAAKEELAAKNLTEGATASALDDAAKVQTESSKALANKMNEKKVAIDAEGKKNYTAGLVDLAKGIKNYATVTNDVKNLRPSLTSMSAVESAAYIVKTIPESSSNLLATLKRAVEFAKENKIEVPSEATSLI